MTRQHATLLILLGATAMSFAALFVRLVDQADGFQILAYRSVSLAGMIALMACLRRRYGILRFLRTLDRSDTAMGAVLALAFTFYIFALLNTSVASTLFLLSASPLFAAILGWVWINERPSRLVWLTIATASLGIAVMISSGFELGRTLGNLYALASAGLFAVMLVLARRSGKADVLGGTFLGGVFSCFLAATCALTIGGGLSVSGYDLGIIFFMGAFTIGIGIGLVTWGTPYVPAAEVSLLVLLESVLSPLWAWVFIGEAMSGRELTGGLLVLGAVALLAITKRPQRSDKPAKA
ncbi:MAG: DMT family transporter [Rhodobacteraceae bacterium]|nr:DMT family transporter [Paracoccaceae bacterium]